MQNITKRIKDIFNKISHMSIDDMVTNFQQMSKKRRLQLATDLIVVGAGADVTMAAVAYTLIAAGVTIPIAPYIGVPLFIAAAITGGVGAHKLNHAKPSSYAKRAFRLAARPLAPVKTRIVMGALNVTANCARGDYQRGKITLDQLEGSINEARDYAARHYPNNPAMGRRTAHNQSHETFLQEARRTEAAKAMKAPAAPGMRN